MSEWIRTSKMLTEQKNKPAGDGIGYNGSYLHQIKLGNTPTPLLFVDAQYPSYSDASINVPYYEWPRHTFKDTRDGAQYYHSFLCAKGRDRAKECPSCELQFDKKDKRLSKRNMKYFTVIALDYFYVRRNEYNDVIYEQPNTPAQRRQWDAAGLEKVFGRVGYLELGPGHAGQLIDIASQVSNTCAMCVEDGKKPAKLFVSKYSCAGCKHVVIDIETTDKTAKDLEQVSIAPHKCNKCGFVGLLDISYECERCDEPRSSEIFDVVLPLAKRGQDTDTSIIIPHGEEIKFIDHYKIPFQGELVPLFDGIAFHPSIEEMYKPLDFDKLFEVERNPKFHTKMINNIKA
jgi:predicted Zn-ribbon and HTH transcriptional regulator